MCARILQKVKKIIEKEHDNNDITQIESDAVRKLRKAIIEELWAETDSHYEEFN